MKLNPILIIIFILFESFDVMSQIYINGKIDNYINRDVNICTQFGDNSELLVTLKTNHTGSFNYNFDESYEKGLYRIYLDNKEYFDLILNEENIEFTTKDKNPVYNMIILKSEENSQLYYFYRENYIIDYKIQVLDKLIEMYPEGKFLKKIHKELQKQNNLKNKYLHKAIKMNPNSFAGRYLTYFYEPKSKAKFNFYEKNEYLKSNYLNYFNFNDAEMLNSDAFTQIIFNYFKLYKSSNPENMYQAAKNILSFLVDKNPKIFNYTFEYILEGFDVIGLSEQSAKLSLEFGNRCSDSDENLNLRIANNINLGIGKKAPDFTAKTINNEEITLSKIESNNILLIFWASWCDHCSYLLPTLYSKKSILDELDFKVITISLDTDSANLKNFLRENGISWPVICDYKSWENDIVKQYSIYATPFMFILDKYLLIKAKPFNEDSLFKYLQQIEKK